MFARPEIWMLMTVVGLHLAGLAATAAARFESYSSSRIRRHVFFSLLLGVGLYAMFSVFLGTVLWMPSSATFSIMVIGATLDTANHA